MKLLWLCNNAPGAVRSAIAGKELGGVNWVDHVLSGLRRQGVTVRILFRGSGGDGVIDENCSYRSIGEDTPWVYNQELENLFCQEIRDFGPDVIHSWGVEYAHALAMVNAAEKEGMLPQTVASIQGLCRYLSEHYLDGIPEKWQRKQTFRDILRKDSMAVQRENFQGRGRMETAAVGKLRHVIGRTTWDFEKTLEMNPERQYHFCNETMRECFYEGRWEYGKCTRHRMFASSCSYPIKGFHILLEALARVREEFPDASVTVTGRSFLAGDVKSRLRRGSYESYLASLAKQYRLEKAITFLGDLSAEQMKMAYLDANLFCLPSTMENSPNVLGEAMLLGLPCVAAKVGGVADLMEDGTEGRICEAGNAAALAEGIKEVFRMEDRAAALGNAAREHARITHDPEGNLRALLDIYRKLA